MGLLSWTSRTARGGFLNQKRQQTSLSLECFASATGVNDNTVDAWMYHGARPSDDNIKNIADVLAGEIEGSDVASIARELRALYWVSDVADMLAEYIANDAVDEAIRRLHQYAEVAYDVIDDQFPVEDREESLAVLADLGAGARIAEPLLSSLIEQEPYEEWREDIRGAGMAWIRRVLSVNLRVHEAEVDDLIRETEDRILENWDISNPKPIPIIVVLMNSRCKENFTKL